MVAGIPWDEIHPDAWPAPRPPKQGGRRRRFFRRRKSVRPPVSPWEPCADCPAPGLCRDVQPERCR